MSMNPVDIAATTLLIIGGVAWGFYAFDVQIVPKIFGTFSPWIYGLVGLSAVHSVLRFAKVY